MKENVRANGNTGEIYDVNIHTHTFCLHVLHAVCTAVFGSGLFIPKC